MVNHCSSNTFSLLLSPTLWMSFFLGFKSPYLSRSFSSCCRMISSGEGCVFGGSDASEEGSAKRKARRNRGVPRPKRKGTLELRSGVPPDPWFLWGRSKYTEARRWWWCGLFVREGAGQHRASSLWGERHENADEGSIMGKEGVYQKQHFCMYVYFLNSSLAPKISPTLSESQTRSFGVVDIASLSGPQGNCLGVKRRSRVRLPEGSESFCSF